MTLSQQRLVLSPLSHCYQCNQAKTTALNQPLVKQALFPTIVLILANIVLDNDEKHGLLQHSFHPSTDFKFLTKREYNKTRGFQHSWLKECSWFAYSVSCDGWFCISCVLFAKHRSSLGQLVMTNFTQAKKHTATA